MQLIYLLLNWLVVIALLGLGLTTIIKNYHSTLNKVFTIFTVSVSIWIVAAYISNDIHYSPRVSVIGNYFVFFFSYVASYVLLWFATTLAHDLKALIQLRRLAIPIFIVGIASFTPLVVAGAERQGSVYAVKFGLLSPIYGIFLILQLVATIVILHKNIHRSTGIRRKHLVVMYQSLGIAIPILLVSEYILPALTGWFGLTNVGILAMAIPVLGLYYGVIKLKLFDLRLIVVRSLAYILSLGTLVGLFIGTTFGVSNILITNKANTTAAIRWVYVIFALVLALIFPYLKRFFDKTTNRLFYRDAYDTQVFLDQFNKVLVSTYDLSSILRKSAEVIEESLKPVYTVFDIKETTYTPRRITGTEGHPEFSEEAIALVRDLTPKIKRKLIIIDELGERYSELQEVLRSNNITIIARLASSVTEEGIGYLILGPKKSGNLYNSQDLKVIEIITNELVVAIQNALHTEEIENFNLTLQAKVDDATRRLRGANKRLVQLDSTKDDFISMASHQLRTPLTSVKGYLSLVLDGDAGSVKPSQRKLLAQAFTSSQRMAYLIADLLNVSRLKTGKFLIQATPVNLADVIEDEIQQLLETIKEKGLTLKYDKPTNFPVIQLDDTKTRQVIMNFIDNAVYYNHAGGQIDIVLSETPKAVELRVIDNGIGVPRAEQYHLFSKFYRAKNAQKARPDGTGLGLFMAKKVIIVQGGSVIFNSKEDHGSTFGFS